MRVGAIDIGTNTVLLLIADAMGGSLVAVEEHATITRLGEGVDRTRALLPEAIARTNACLAKYGQIARAAKVERLDVVGTSAMRDARGGDAVRAHVREVFGVEARVISGDEEAKLTFAGALSGMAIDSRAQVVFDIGGGSTEVVAGSVDDHGRPIAISFAHSFDVGSVRLTERHVKSDPPSPADLDALTNDARKAFAPLRSNASLNPTAAREPIGIAGTLTTLAAVSLRLNPYDGARVHGHRMTTSELRSVVSDLARLPLAMRRELPGLEPKRADVIVAGGIIAIEFLDAIGAEAVRISDRGVRWGLAALLAQ
jgi:exopolyphosphatase/guanosine-5'-triphosphate,3'-diphosphate pyrophosphatase